MPGTATAAEENKMANGERIAIAQVRRYAWMNIIAGPPQYIAE